MAPQPTYESPHVQLGRLMVAARRRGLSFEEFWMEAVRPRKPIVMVTHPDPPEGAVRWPTDRNQRVDWQVGISGSKEGWQRAYERRVPTRSEAALGLLAPGLEALDAVAEERAEDELASRRTGIEQHAAVPSAA